MSSQTRVDGQLDDLREERAEWRESVDGLIAVHWIDVAASILAEINAHARGRGVPGMVAVRTPYRNTIPADQLAPYPGIWTTDGATPERANGYTASGTAHVLQARDGTLWRLTIEQTETADPGDAVPQLRPMLDATRLVRRRRRTRGPFVTEAEAKARGGRPRVNEPGRPTSARTARRWRSGFQPPTTGRVTPPPEEARRSTCARCASSQYAHSQPR